MGPRNIKTRKRTKAQQKLFMAGHEVGIKLGREQFRDELINLLGLERRFGVIGR